MLYQKGNVWELGDEIENLWFGLWCLGGLGRCQ